MEVNELEWLAFEAARHSVIVEIGSYLGRSTRALGDNCPGVVYAVDHWNGPAEFEPPHPREKLYEMFLSNLADLVDVQKVNRVFSTGVNAKVVPVRLSSLKAAESGWIPQPDMIFIDGSHDLDSVRQDIAAWAKVIKPGGLFCGHDAHWPGVAEARRLYLPQHMTGIGSIWAVDNYQGLKA